MGRGRAKAKQTKVARRLKYQELDTDYAALQRELGGNGGSAGEPDNQPNDHEAEYGAYADDGEDDARQAG